MYRRRARRAYSNTYSSYWRGSRPVSLRGRRWGSTTFYRRAVRRVYRRGGFFDRTAVSALYNDARCTAVFPCELRVFLSNMLPDGICYPKSALFFVPVTSLLLGENAFIATMFKYSSFRIVSVNTRQAVRRASLRTFASGYSSAMRDTISNIFELVPLGRYESLTSIFGNSPNSVGGASEYTGVTFFSRLDTDGIYNWLNNQTSFNRSMQHSWAEANRGANPADPNVIPYLYDYPTNLFVDLTANQSKLLTLVCYNALSGQPRYEPVLDPANNPNSQRIEQTFRFVGSVMTNEAGVVSNSNTQLLALLPFTNVNRNKTVTGYYINGNGAIVYWPPMFFASMVYAVTGWYDARAGSFMNVQVPGPNAKPMYTHHSYNYLTKNENPPWYEATFITSS